MFWLYFYNILYIRIENLIKLMERKEHEALFQEIPQELESLLRYITEIIENDTKVKRIKVSNLSHIIFIIY